MTFEDLYVDPRGRTPRGPYIAALAVLLAVAAFYHFVLSGGTPAWGKVVLIYPFVVLIARRLHDMGVTGWLAAVPGALLIATAVLQLSDIAPGAATPVMWAALAVSAGFALWGVAGKGQAEASGAPAAA